jgi:hypothetical protein
MHAEKLAIIRRELDENWKKISLDDAKAKIQLDEEYVALEIQNDVYEYRDDLWDVIKDVFSELNTLMRDAMKLVEEQTA